MLIVRQTTVHGPHGGGFDSVFDKCSVLVGEKSHQNPNLGLTQLTQLIVRGSMFRLKLGKIWDGFTFNLNCYGFGSYCQDFRRCSCCVSHEQSIILELETWFALTRKGGQLIPLQQCGQLAVYRTASGSQPLMKPTLKPVSAQQYQGIPGRISHFPEPEFTAEVGGTPKAGEVSNHLR